MDWHFRLQFLFFVNKKFPNYAFCVKELRSEYFEYLQRYLNIHWIDIQTFYSRRHATIAEANVGVYWEKALSRRQKIAHVGFVSHQDTLFQPNDISVGTSFSCRKWRYAHSFLRPYTGNKYPLAIMYNLLIILLFCRFE